jgi:hypothetical protein
MLPAKRTSTNVGVGIAVFLQLAGLLFVQKGDTAAILGLVLILVSIPVFIWGCMNYAEGKGHSKWLGVAGLAGLIGLIVLILLPDQDRPGSVRRPQRRKIVGLITLVVGIGVAVLGAWLYRLADDVRLERLLGAWPTACVLLGLCIVVVGSFVLTLDNASRPERSPNRKS